MEITVCDKNQSLEQRDKRRRKKKRWDIAPEDDDKGSDPFVSTSLINDILPEINPPSEPSVKIYSILEPNVAERHVDISDLEEKDEPKNQTNLHDASETKDANYKLGDVSGIAIPKVIAAKHSDGESLSETARLDGTLVEANVTERNVEASVLEEKDERKKQTHLHDASETKDAVYELGDLPGIALPEVITVKHFCGVSLSKTAQLNGTLAEVNSLISKDPDVFPECEQKKSLDQRSKRRKRRSRWDVAPEDNDKGCDPSEDTFLINDTGTNPPMESSVKICSILEPKMAKNHVGGSHLEKKNDGKRQTQHTTTQVIADNVSDEASTSCLVSDIPNICKKDIKMEPFCNHLKVEIAEIKEKKVIHLSAHSVAKDDTDAVMKDNFLPQTLPSFGQRDSVGRNRKKLLVLDVNGLLADLVSYVPYGYKPDNTISRKSVFKRPFCDDFLQFCFERFDVGIWSSRTRKNVDMVINFLMGDLRNKLLFCWDQSHCTTTKFCTVENRDKPLVLKELKKLWEKLEPDLPWEKGDYNESNTILLDDSPYKALRNPANTAIFPHTYRFKDKEDTSLGPGGDLRVYLEGLSMAVNVQKHIEQNPFGQRPITESNPSWDFYRKVIYCDTNMEPSQDHTRTSFTCR